ncbi:MAG: hypothetical protein JJU33_09045 [Phycisphaerales bacterium]|nr:hypothetical protein [Phycisphaerales bacterium]
MSTPATTPETLIKEGKLDEAIDAAKEQVRADPSKAEYRVSLFQLFAITGDWARALNQLNVASELDPGASMMAQVCGPALQAEGFRREVFSGKRSPMIFGEPPEWIGLAIEAVRLLASGHPDKAAAARAEWLEKAEAVPGAIDDEPFGWLADADDRMGPVLEALIDGKYFWVPMSRIESIQIEPPTDLRDLVWTPATLQWTTGASSVALLFARYPGSELASDPLIRLGRKTEWNDQGGGGFFTGLGQREFATDKGEHALLQTRSVRFDHPGGPAEAASGG